MISVCFDVDKLVPFYCKYHNSDWESKLSVADGLNYYEEFVCNDTNCNFVDSGNMYPGINVDDLYNKQAEILQGLGTTNVNNSLVKFPLTTNSCTS